MPEEISPEENEIRPAPGIELLTAPEAAAETLTEAPETRRISTFSALRHRNYQFFWTGSFLSNIGTWMQAVAQGWLVRELTASPFLIGLVAFAGAFPQLAFSLFSGVFADLFNRRKLLLTTQVVQLICAAVLGTLVLLRERQIWPVLSIWHVIIISFISGLAMTFAAPTYQALTFDLVGPEDLPSAVALNSTQFNLSRIIGPTASGLLFVVIGTAGSFYLNSLSFLAVIAALLLLRFPSWQPPARRDVRELLRQTVAGLRYVRGRPRVTALLLIASVTSLFGLPYLTFLPVFTRDVLKLDARGLAQLWAALGGGAVLSALAMAFLLGNYGRRGRFLLAGTLLFGAAVSAFALSRTFAWSIFWVVLAGAAITCVTTTINTLLHMLVRDSMRGRVMSMYILAFVGFPPLGSLLVGALADLLGVRWGRLGTQWVLAAGGLVIVLFGLYVLAAQPRIWELE